MALALFPTSYFNIPNGEILEVLSLKRTKKITLVLNIFGILNKCNKPRKRNEVYTLNIHM